MYKKSYESYEDSKGLYYLLDPKITILRQKTINTWNNTIAKDAVEYFGPILVPTEVLKKSGHLDEFKDQIFHIKNKKLCLRPETAQSLFTNLKAIRRQIKGKILKIHQIGKAYRNEKSTRDGSLRKCEFEQMELHVLAEKNYDFITIYRPMIEQFFTELGLKPLWKEISDKPHYSKLTIDLYIENVEVGCINYRGTHDLYNLPEKEKKDLEVYEISLGLDRIVYFLDRLNTEIQ